MFILQRSRAVVPATPRLTTRRTGNAVTLGVAGLLAAGILALQLAVEHDVDGILLLLVVPIALAGRALGSAAGLLAAAISMGLLTAADLARDSGLGVLDYLVGAVVFTLTAALAARAWPDPAGIDQEKRTPLGQLLTSPPDITASPAGESLSPREREVLELVALGATNAQIAERFMISEETVKSHVKHILHKLGAGNRTKAALRYVELYGRPSSEVAQRTGEHEAPESEARRAVATGERRARVAALPSDDRVTLKLEDGLAIDLPLLESVRHVCTIGDPALLYLDRDGVPIGWYLPDAGLGVDMRGPEV
jgi:DNA-binding CsgD family transcriptional regulator